MNSCISYFLNAHTFAPKNRQASPEQHDARDRLRRSSGRLSTGPDRIRLHLLDAQEHSFQTIQMKAISDCHPLVQFGIAATALHTESLRAIALLATLFDQAAKSF